MKYENFSQFWRDAMIDFLHGKSYVLIEDIAQKAFQAGWDAHEHLIKNQNKGSWELRPLCAPSHLIPDDQEIAENPNNV
jgi:hypothetical protein